MTFRVGQKVVCVETWPYAGGGRGDEVGPVEGQIYIVREVGIGIHLTTPNELQLRLAEIVNPVINYKGGTYEMAFRANRFRPVVERKTDISIFTKMLTGKRVDA